MDDIHGVKEATPTIETYCPSPFVPWFNILRTKLNKKTSLIVVNCKKGLSISPD